MPSVLHFALIQITPHLRSIAAQQVTLVTMTTVEGFRDLGRIHATIVMLFRSWLSLNLKVITR